ncbi:MAG: type VII secretion-associated serine protease mycosin [Actinobacteria bacterium]|nr:MAG: type VII secretion-associated serine protease mycosin [Actinomycetota bacterium]
MRAVAVVGLLAGCGLLPAGPAAAQPGCGPPAAADPQVTGVPWPQSRYDAGRLAGIADGSGVTVAVIDSGVDATQPVLAGAVLRGRDLLDKAGTGQRDCVGHGTAVASVIAGAPLDGIPVGLAPRTHILPYRVSEQEIVDGHPSGNPGTATGVAEAIRDATDRGARVINLSLVLSVDHPEVRAAVGYAQAHDVVVVAAIGNGHRDGGVDPVPYPAGYPGVLGVGAVDENGLRVPSSPVGPYVDLVAPGRAVVAAVPGHGLARFDGTSFAAPFVSATAALIRQYRPRLTAVEVAARILATTDPAPAGGRSGGYGYGILNPYRAVTDQLGGAPVPVSASAARPAPAVPATDRAPRTPALTLSLGGLVLAGLVALGASVVPRGAARGWRPGRT